MFGELLLQADAIKGGVEAVWVLVVSFLIFFMQPGFALLEAGQVRAKNAGNVVMKNLTDWSLGVLVFFALGAGVSAVAGFVTTPGVGVDLAGAFSQFTTPGSWIGWLFGAVFAMTAATIVSGAVAERMSYAAYVFYVIALVAVIYPVVSGFAWGGDGLLSSAGYLGQLIGNTLGSGPVGYKDFAGATVVHALGGIAGLTAAYMVGPRKGRFDENGDPSPIPGHSMLFAVIGTLFLAFGWYAFNVGTQATVLTVEGGAVAAFEGDALGRVALNTTLAMGAGMVASTLVTTLWEGKPDPLFGANGLLAGLVAITGACAHVTWAGGIALGLIGGAQTPLVYRWVVDSLGIDDVCGVFAVHGSAGFIGTILIPFFDVAGFSVAQLVMQLTGSLVIGTWTVLTTMAVLLAADSLFGLRVSDEDELTGLDRVEHGVAAYPEFGENEGAVPDGGVTTAPADDDVATDGGVSPTAATADDSDGGEEL
jgi:Amt family ammonium transporter